MALNRKRIHTINDLNDYSNVSIPSSSSSTQTPGIHEIGHIPDLPSSTTAESILKRIYSEFSEIATRRGYSISTLTELCCCNDGFCSSKNKRRKYKKVSDNILGYNYHPSGKRRSCEIHLRLRHPRTHAFYDYNDIAGTMCHELAHCEIGSHSVNFFKLMEEIEGQHAVFVTRGMVLDSGGFPMGSGQAFRLGGGDDVLSQRGRRPINAQAAAKRSQNICKGEFVLGGDNLHNALPPREAARIAAEKRMQEACKHCLPCNEVVDLIEGDDDKQPDVIYCNDSDDDSDCVIVKIEPAAQGKRCKPSTARNTQSSSWICKACTFENASELTLVCEICRSPKVPEEETLERITDMVKREDIKEKEVQNSLEEFHGFNIYGNSKKSSATMKHLT